MNSPLFEKLSASGPEAAEFLKNVKPIVVARHPEPLPPGAGDNTCWIWQGPGDFRARDEQDKKVGAQRRAHELFLGPIPEDKRVARTCGNSFCVNPRHLKLATASEIAAQSDSGFRLAPEQRRQIERELGLGDSQAAIAARHGVTQGAVSQIKRRLEETKRLAAQAPRDQAPAQSLAEWLDRQDQRLGPIGKLARGESMTDAARETALSKATKEYMTYSLLLREYGARVGRERAAEAAAPITN